MPRPSQRYRTLLMPHEPRAQDSGCPSDETLQHRVSQVLAGAVDGVRSALNVKPMRRKPPAALILFIKDGEPTEVIETADKTIQAHASFRSASGVADPSVRRDYVMVSAAVSQRDIKLALLPGVCPKVDSLSSG